MYKPIYKQKITSIDNLPPDKYQLDFIKKTRCLKCGRGMYKKNRIVFAETTGGNVLWWHGLINSDVYSCERI